MIFKPFQSIRPREDLAEIIAELPYDVYHREEARKIVDVNPISFLAIDRPETICKEGNDMYAYETYAKGKSHYHHLKRVGSFVQDTTPCFYLYVLTKNGKSQCGLVGVASIDEYLSGVIKKHENTRADKEIDRTRHIDVLDAQTGPIFLTYRKDEELTTLVQKVRLFTPEYDFKRPDGVRHQVWKIAHPSNVRTIEEIFRRVESAYIADGHHRAKAASNVATTKRILHPSDTGQEAYNYFLSVLFPADELSIMDYNRVVYDTNGLSTSELLSKIEEDFTIDGPYDFARKPMDKHQIAMYLDKKWYMLIVKNQKETDSVADSLDVAILQEKILTPILGIENITTSNRIGFVGGIKGLSELEVIASEKGGVAFAMFPTSIEELFSVSDAGELMPPKSTWFEPKLLSGLFIHQLSKSPKPTKKGGLLSLNPE